MIGWTPPKARAASDGQHLANRSRLTQTRISFSLNRGMRWTFCGALWSPSVTRLNWCSSTWKATTGFSGFWHWVIFFTSTTGVYTRGSMRSTSGSTKSGSGWLSNIDGPGCDRRPGWLRAGLEHEWPYPDTKPRSWPDGGAATSSGSAPAPAAINQTLGLTDYCWTVRLNQFARYP